MPSALATAGMIMVSGVGVVDGAGVTGVTRFTLTVVETVLPLVAIREDEGFNATTIAPLCVPTPRPSGSAVTFRIVPLNPDVPVPGEHAEPILGRRGDERLSGEFGAERDGVVDERWDC